jgi:hypothetical protein
MKIANEANVAWKEVIFELATGLRRRATESARGYVCA